MRTATGILFALLVGTSAGKAQEAVFDRTSLAVSNKILVPSTSRTHTYSLPAIETRESDPFASLTSLSLPEDAGANSQNYPSRSSRTRDAYDLAMGFEYFHYRSSLFTANLEGLHTSFTYFRYKWLGFEGNVVAGFGSSNFMNEGSRMVLYTGGPRIAYRETRIQPWLHALVGGLRIRPQVAQGINGFAAQLGGGVDWRYKPLISLRMESDYVRSQLYSSGQNSFQIGGGFVFHF